ncbi:multicopper oxidase family protein [Oceanibacterium hippocampi]|uniref:Multicopper oxidase mco n=1 Tax=Oceanibacterium hippocampi TaxID=745714 RepID=A0A1Y5TFZ8_9PROT|nr:multicopper oxidase family protein [Oceanibacterium hippocampi]SLN63125.1 Multicopper oxidase mco [Oceanibacterium hippocampi]
MKHPERAMLTRRTVLGTGLAAGLAAPFAGIVAGHAATSGPARTIRIRPAPADVRLVPEPYGLTPTWCFNGAVPGPELRLLPGEPVRIEVENGLAEATTVHWHGLRVPNAMDGVPHLTQPPIEPGERFVYEFAAPDAGTYWYHPHMRSHEQVGRGLAGPLIVEEPSPPRVDRELVWMLDDWRLTQAARITDDFGSPRDLSHNGRVGNTVTINGRVPDAVPVRPGERLRLRLINGANARIFALDFGDQRPLVIALDGQPVTPHEPPDGLVTLGPAMRADLILDIAGTAGTRSAVIDRFYRGSDYRLVDLALDGEPLRAGPPDWPIALPSNGLPEPDVKTATRHDVVFNGGMMGGMVMQQMGAGGGTMPEPPAMRDMMMAGRMWFINGVAATGHLMEPVMTLERGRSHVIAMTNATAWHHPIHLHGHSFRVLSRNGEPTRHREWQDTVLMAPRERVEIAFVADNPGDWMFHCHILEHQAAGMMGVIRVA